MNTSSLSFRSNFNWYLMMALAVVRYWFSYRFLWAKAPQEHIVFLKVGIVLWILFVGWVLFSLSRQMVQGALRLKVDGPFRFVAHPAYASYIVADLVFLAYDHSALALLIAGAYYFFIIRTAYLEECQMMRRWPRDARFYYERVISVHRLFGEI